MSRPSFTRVKKVGRRPLLICLAVLIATPAAAQDNATSAAPAKRPRIGLALAGGGARGGAHIGVLKVLEEQHVPIDCIAGTSMGALVGGGYAAGLRASEIEQFVTHIDWKFAVSGVGSRPLEPVEQKRFDDASGTLELGVKNGRIILPSGLIKTSRIENVLRTYVATARGVSDFNSLPIPYRAVATDMLTGQMVVLDHGDIATAMRASMAIPGAFAPVVIDQYVLSDGYVVRNLPIDVVRETCADIVIAVNLVKPTPTRQQLQSPLNLIWRAGDITMEANERIQLQTLTERDVRIDVDVGDVSGGEFDRTAETIPFGEKAARAVATRLAALSVPEEEYMAWRRRVETGQKAEIRIAQVQFKGLERVNPDYLRTLTRVRAGDTVDIGAISDDAARLAALNDLQGVEYRLEGDPGNPVLVWEPQEKQLGPNYLRPSFGVYLAGGGDVLLELDAQFVRRWVNAYGAQWRNRLTVGTTLLAETSFYQPLDTPQTFFVEPTALVSRSLEYVYNNYDRIAQYFFVDLGGQIDFGVNLGSSSQIRAGYWVDDRRTELDTGSPQLPTGRFTDAGLTATAFYDTRNSSSFATQGTTAELQYFGSAAALGANREWNRLEAAARQAFRVPKTTVWLTAAGGSALGSTLPPDRAFSLGGPQSFPGYGPGEVRAGGYWLLDLDLLWHIADIMPIANQALYGGLGVHGGDVYERVDKVPNGTLYSVAGYVGGRTPIGTLTIGVGKATGSFAGWLTIGTPVGSGSILNEPLFR